MKSVNKSETECTASASMAADEPKTAAVNLNTVKRRFTRVPLNVTLTISWSASFSFMADDMWPVSLSFIADNLRSMQIYNLISYFAKKMGQTARFFIKSVVFNLCYPKIHHGNEVPERALLAFEEIYLLLFI